jgi:hypothetical protein
MATMNASAGVSQRGSQRCSPLLSDNVIASAKLPANARAIQTEWPSFACFTAALCYHQRVRYRPTLVLFLGFSCCSSPHEVADTAWTPLAPPDLGAVVARTGDVPIYAKQVLGEARKTGQSPRQALQALIELNLLAELARKRELHLPDSSDTEVKSALVARMLERDLESKITLEAIPDSALRPLYDKLQDGFVHSRLVEVGVLAVYTGELMKVAPKAERAQTAKELAAAVEKKPPKTLDEFAQVARDPEWSRRDVVYSRFFQSVDQPLSREIGVEVQKLRAPGDTTRMVGDKSGYYIARYIGERPPENITFEQARDGLRAGYYERWRKQKFLDYSSELLSHHKVEEQPELLSAIEQGP